MNFGHVFICVVLFMTFMAIGEGAQNITSAIVANTAAIIGAKK